jgi:hypothetical protein
MEKIYNINLDFVLSKGYPKMEFIKGDIGANKINIKLTKNNEPVSLNNKTVTVTIRKVDNTSVVYNVNVVGADTVAFITDANALACPGAVYTTVEVYEGSIRLTSMKFLYFVLESMNNSDDIASFTDYPILTKLISEVQAIEENESYRVAAELVRQNNEQARIQKMQELEGTLKTQKKTVNLSIDNKLKTVRNLYGAITLLRKLDANTDLRVAFGMNPSKNINGTPNFIEAVTLANANPVPANTWTTAGTIQFYHYGSDWLGPYIVRALNNADGDRINNGNAFTGGFHGYNGNIGTASGGATARNLYFKTYTDDRELLDGQNRYANDIRLEFTNRVQGWNTKKADGTGREILEERYIVEFIEDIMYVQCEIEALEDIVIDTLYGLQALTNVVNDATSTIWFLNGTSNPQSYGYSAIGSADMDAGSKSTGSICNDVLFNRVAGNLKMHMFIKDGIGLGKRENLDASQSPFFYTGSTGKLYANLVKGIPLSLKANEKVSWQGGYRFFR